MRLRQDYVTNSSSSSFVIARKGELTEKQKGAIIKFVEKTFLGEVKLTPDSTEEEVKKFIKDRWYGEDEEKKIREALANGKSIYSDIVDFECCAYEYEEIYQRVFNTLETVSDENFEVIDGDLSY